MHIAPRRVMARNPLWASLSARPVVLDWEARQRAPRPLPSAEEAYDDADGASRIARGPRSLCDPTRAPRPEHERPHLLGFGHHDGLHPGRTAQPILERRKPLLAC